MRAREASRRRGCAHLFVQHAQIEEVATCPGGTPRKLTPPCPLLVAAVGAGLSAHAGARRNTGAGDFLRCPVERIRTAPGVMMHSPQRESASSGRLLRMGLLGTAPPFPTPGCWCAHRAGGRALEGGGLTGRSARSRCSAAAPHAGEAALPRIGRGKGRLSAAGTPAMKQNKSFFQGEST